MTINEYIDIMFTVFVAMVITAVTGGAILFTIAGVAKGILCLIPKKRKKRK